MREAQEDIHSTRFWKGMNEEEIDLFLGQDDNNSFKASAK
jgi:hypothetical protein